MRSSTIAAAIFAIVGGSLGCINVWNNATQVNGGTFVVNDLTAVVCGLAVASALLSLALGAIAKRSAITTALAVVAIIGCTITSVGYTLGRVGDAADQGAAAALAHNAQIERAEALVSQLDNERKEEAANGGCKTECKKIEKRLDDARASLAALGVRQVTDPAGERIEAISGGWITAVGYRTAHPAIVAGALEISVSLLLTIAGLFAASPQRQATVIDITPINPVLAVLPPGRAISNKALARQLGLSEATASRRVRDLRRQGLLTVERKGRELSIRRPT